MVLLMPYFMYQLLNMFVSEKSSRIWEKKTYLLLR